MVKVRGPKLLLKELGDKKCYYESLGPKMFLLLFYTLFYLATA
jgi:hypothetical protein